MKRFAIGVALALPCLVSGVSQAAEISGGIVRVGVLNDISGIFQDTNGMGSVEAARMAAEDFNGGGKGIKVEIVYANHQNKADVGSAIARKWLDVDGVDAIVDVPNSAVGLTINSLLRDCLKNCHRERPCETFLISRTQPASEKLSNTTAMARTAIATPGHDNGCGSDSLCAPS